MQCARSVGTQRRSARLVAHLCRAIFFESHTMPVSIALGGSAAITANWTALSLVSLRSPQPIGVPEYDTISKVSSNADQLQSYWRRCVPRGFSHWFLLGASAPLVEATGREQRAATHSTQAKKS